MIIVIVTICEWYYNSSKLITKYGSIQTLSVSSYYVQSQIFNNKIRELPNPKKKKKNELQRAAHGSKNVINWPLVFLAYYHLNSSQKKKKNTVFYNQHLNLNYYRKISMNKKGENTLRCKILITFK